MKRASAAYCVSVAFLAVLFIGVVSAHAESTFRKDRLSVVTSEGVQDFTIEIAETREQQSRGLMFRRSLGQHEGMLFMHPEPTLVTMWMRNTYIPLDMVFIKANGQVHRIEEYTEPFSERIIESGTRVTAVLEIAAGTCARIGLKAGDVVRHKHFGTAQ